MFELVVLFGIVVLLVMLVFGLVDTTRRLRLLDERVSTTAVASVNNGDNGGNLQRLTATVASNYGQLGSMLRGLSDRLAKVEKSNINGDGGGNSGSVNNAVMENRLRRVETSLLDVGESVRADRQTLDRLTAELTMLDGRMSGTESSVQENSASSGRLAARLNSLEVKDGTLSEQNASLDDRLRNLRTRYDRTAASTMELQLDASARLRGCYVEQGEFYGLSDDKPETNIDSFVQRLAAKSMFRCDYVLSDRVPMQSTVSDGTRDRSGEQAYIVLAYPNSLRKLIVVFSAEFSGKWYDRMSVQLNKNWEGALSVYIQISAIRLNLLVVAPYVRSPTPQPDLYANADGIAALMNLEAAVLLYVLQPFGDRDTLRERLRSDRVAIRPRDSLSADDPYGLFWRDSDRECVLYRADQLQRLLLLSEQSDQQQMVHIVLYANPVQFRDLDTDK